METMSSALAALLGALVGAGASVIAMLIQQRYQNKRELLKIAADLALREYDRRAELLLQTGGGRMPPISAYVHYQMRVLEHMARGTFTPETIRTLTEEYDRITGAYSQLTNERTEARKHAT
jgi:hypothetical protein